MSEPIEFSTAFAEIAGALLTAQQKFEAILKTESNPYFNSKYADLSSVLDVVRPMLNEVGIVIIQGSAMDGEWVIVETRLLHAPSSQWVRTGLRLKPNKSWDKEEKLFREATPQAVGSAITYGRRYGIQALCGVAPEDDDGNAASGSASQPREGREYKLREPSKPGATPETHGQVKLQTMLKWASESPAKDEDKDQGPWYNAGDGEKGQSGRRFWTRKADVGTQLLEAKGREAIMTLVPSRTKPNTYQVVSVDQIVTDEIPLDYDS